MFEITGFLKSVEEDNYENGCMDTGFETWIDYTITAKTWPELKEMIVAFIDCGEDAVTINPCEDDLSRVDVCKTENAEGYSPSASEWAEFKAGRINLYYVVYTCYVQFVTREPAYLSE